MRRHEEVEFAVAELERFNIRYQIRNTEGGHVEIAWQVSESTEVRKIYTSKTASDHRTRLNARSYIRRALREDGVNIDPVSQRKKPSLLEKALRSPEPVQTVPEQIDAMRSELAYLTDLMLDIANSITSLREREISQTVKPSDPVLSADPARIVQTVVAEERKPRIKRKKAIDFVSSNWNTISAIARDMELPVQKTYQKLYYLKGKELVELYNGNCRLTPKKPELVRAKG